MLYAIFEDNKILATPGATGHCSCCDQEMIAKCGQVNIWHWAHKSAAECDDWYTGETDWHLRWKSRFDARLAEKRVERDGAWHRADILTENGIALEFQHSAISPETLAEREDFYENLIWVIDVHGAYTEGRLALNRYSDYAGFRWKHARRSLAAARRPVLLDLGNELLYVKKIHLENWAGWGNCLSYPDFVRMATQAKRCKRYGITHKVNAIDSFLDVFKIWTVDKCAS